MRSLEEDLKRRDFTVNAFALNDEGNVIDKFDGLADLKAKLLRAVGNPAERFNEDALRIMRGFRFAASLDFNIEANTFAAMASHAPLLEKISVERSFIEFDKLLLAPFWRKGITAMLASQAQKYLPHLEEAHENLQGLLDHLAEDYHFKSSEQAWAALLLSLDITDSRAFLRSWKTSTQFQKDVETIVTIYRARLQSSLDKKQVYRYGKDLIEQAEDLRIGFGLPVDIERIERLDEALTIHDKHEIVVNGSILIKEMAYKPGPDLGRTLKQVEDAIVLGELANDKAAILEWIREASK